MLKCAAEYLAIRDEIVATNNAKAKEEEKNGRLKEAIENSIRFCENNIAEAIECRVQKGQTKIEFYYEFSNLTKTEDSPLGEQYFYLLKTKPNASIDGRMTGEHYFFDEKTPYHYETIKKYLAAHCINIEFSSKENFQYNKIGNCIYTHKVWISLPNNPPCF